jgi:cellulose synthase/poly-beta-1,6-N-acetylglucosamine synthase-like glycosyltransferase
MTHPPNTVPQEMAGQDLAHGHRRRIQPLPEQLCARRLLSRGQTFTIVGLGASGAVIAAACLFGFGPSPLWWAQAAVAVVTSAYVLVIAYKFLVVLIAGKADVLRPGAADCPEVPFAELPDFTVLVPLYREENVLTALLARLSGLHYPAERLQVLLLVEEDDTPTRAALDGIDLAPQFEVVVIPPSQPRTKPKACNVGLERARGEFCVIYDAEDRPEPRQLLKAVAAFRSVPEWVVCVQAELQYWNPYTNWLTRCFAAEYAMNFSLFLRGLDRFRLPIPLGGTSNHFRTEALLSLGGWDPYNVTEDADLGIRIARRGWGVRMMASITEEEANSRPGNWLRQRSRWIKGYYQTWLVHMRSPARLLRELGPRRFLSLQATLGMATITTLLNPIFWALTVVYLFDGPARISPLFSMPVLYLGVLAMLGGNLLMVYILMLGCMERGLLGAMRAQLALPVYWALMSAAAYKALYQLLNPRRRHYWELTEHGLVAEQGDPPAAMTALSAAARESAAAASQSPAGYESRRPGLDGESGTADHPVPAAAAAVRPAISDQGSSAHRGQAERIRLPRMAGVIVILILAGSVTVVLSRPHLGDLLLGRSANLASAPAGNGLNAATAAALDQTAAEWISQQISHSATVACDPSMCSALVARGIPPGNVVVLGTTAANPLGAELVVATPDIRRQFGRRLESFYAPSVIASFGSGPDQVNVRLVAQNGASTYLTALRQDVAARVAAGAQLLGNARIKIAAQARIQLRAGEVDTRLLITLPALASEHPIQILAFGSAGPHASPGVPFSSVDLSGSGALAGMTDDLYLSWIIAFERAQRPPFAGDAVVLRSGERLIVRVEFSKPSPMGLLGQGENLRSAASDLSWDR